MGIIQQLPLAMATLTSPNRPWFLTVNCAKKRQLETLTWSVAGGTLLPSWVGDGKTYASDWTTADDIAPSSWLQLWQPPATDQVCTFGCTSIDGGSASWTVDCRASALTDPGKPTLFGPTGGPSGLQAGPFSFVFPTTWYIGLPDLVVTPRSYTIGAISVPINGDTFQATSGGPDVSSVTIAGGASSTSFWLRPASPGPRRISIDCTWPHGPKLAGTTIVFNAS